MANHDNIGTFSSDGARVGRVATCAAGSGNDGARGATRCGRAQHWGGPIEEIRPGDVVWFSPGEKHWHGAAPTTALTHIAIQEQFNGKAVDWLEKVSDEQYQAK